MRVRRWAAFLALYLVVGCFLVLGPVRLDQARATETEEQRLLELINQYRQENGLGPLVPSDALSTSAGRHSQDMSSHDFFSHGSRESSYYPGGSSPAERAAREGYPTNVYMGENIALGQQTAEEVFEAWRNSPTHDAAMLGEQYTAVGLGHVDSYWTADFGSATNHPSSLGTLEPYAGRVVEPTAKERPTDEQTTGEQAPIEGTTSTETTEQTSTERQTTAEQEATDAEVRTAEDTPDPEPVGDATPRTTSSPQSPTEGTTAEQYAGETGLAELPDVPEAGLGTGNPGAGAVVQGATTAPAEGGVFRASPVETEAMETALATREVVPEELVRQTSPAPEQPTGEPAAGPSLAALVSGIPGADAAGITPVATRKPPDTGEASLLTLLLGGFLLLCGLLVYGAIRR